MDPADKKAIGKAMKRSRAPFVLRKKDIASSLAVDKYDLIVIKVFAKR